MKKILLAAIVGICQIGMAEDVIINNEPVEMHRLIERQIAPGTTYYRLHFPSYPLNVNMVIVDLDNPWVSVENSIPNGSAKSLELLSSAAERLSTAEHKAVVAQNANFWAVTSQTPDGKVHLNQTRNISVRNGMMVTECNQHYESPFGGVGLTGALVVAPDKTAYLDYATAALYYYTTNKFVKTTIHQCNKTVHPDEVAMYNAFYGRDTKFRPLKSVKENDYYVVEDDDVNDAIEVLCDLCEGNDWAGGKDIQFEVKEVRAEAGHGTLGDHDLALVGRGAGLTSLSHLTVGTVLTLNYNLKFRSGISGVDTPEIYSAIAGNLLMMRDGSPLQACGSSDYDRNTYARSLYGISADGKRLYMMVIDKSTDPVYGKSAGLNTWKAAQIAKHFGCTNMLQCDGGGSAQLYVTDKVINKTTESTPRKVANALMVFDDAAADTGLSYIDIDNVGEVINVECGQSYVPKVLLYNQYGSLLGMEGTGYTITCSPNVGTVFLNSFIASAEPQFGTITVTYAGVSVTRKISVGGAIDGLQNVLADASGGFEIYPAAARAGQRIAVNAEGITAVEVFNLGGSLVTRVEASAGGCCHIDAPATAGIYLINALTTKGRLSAKLLVQQGG